VYGKPAPSRLSYGTTSVNAFTVYFLWLFYEAVSTAKITQTNRGKEVERGRDLFQDRNVRLGAISLRIS
jgi:hypothetical protein